MMGFSNHNDSHMADSFNSKKLRRPLIPRSAISATTTTCSTTSSYSTSDFFTLQDHLGTTEQGKSQLNDHHPVSTSRWSPTAEQLQVLEDLYRQGTRTPSTEQIRSITSQLQRFGKIEGKNVFYWFQNHKARERQKRRRQMEEAALIGKGSHVETLEKKGSGLSARPGFQVEYWCKSCLSSTDYNTNGEESISMCKAAESRRVEWLQHNPEILHDESLPGIIHNKGHVLDSLSSPPHLIMSTNSNTCSTTSITLAAVATDHHLPKPKNFIDEDFSIGDDYGQPGQAQTLDLFPVRSDIGSIFEEKTLPAGTSLPMMNLSPYHFIEFL